MLCILMHASFFLFPLPPPPHLAQYLFPSLLPLILLIPSSSLPLFPFPLISLSPSSPLLSPFSSSHSFSVLSFHLLCVSLFPFPPSLVLLFTTYPLPLLPTVFCISHFLPTSCQANLSGGKAASDHQAWQELGHPPGSGAASDGGGGCCTWQTAGIASPCNV